MAFLTMRCLRQSVATHGNGFGLFSRAACRSDLLLIATGCNHGRSIKAPSVVVDFGDTPRSLLSGSCRERAMKRAASRS
jgi:hypothetical protein